MNETTCAAIHDVIQTARDYQNEIGIILVANVRGRTAPHRDYDVMSAESEYLSDVQFDEILNTLRERGFGVRYFFEENDFLKACLADIEHGHDCSRLLVINSAQKGIHPGRKSLIPAFCHLNGLLYAGSDPYTVSFSRDKSHWNALAKLAGLPVCNSWCFDPVDGWLYGHPKSGDRVIVKLCGEASSIGLGSDNIMQYTSACDALVGEIARTYGKRVLVTDFISGREIETPFLRLPNDVFVLPPAGIAIDGHAQLNDMILDYDIRGKHLFSHYDYGSLYPSENAGIIRVAERAARIFNIRSLGRIDFRVDNDGNHYITDISTNPHLTRTMTFGFDLIAAGFDYSAVYEALIGATIKWAIHDKRI